MPLASEKRNIILLAVGQALFQSGSVLIMTVGGLAGYLLAADKSLATLPIAAMMAGTALATIPASMFMGRFGRRAGFVIGTLLGVTGGALAVAGLIGNWFWVFCLGHVLAGAYQGFAQFYRFAAAEAASEAFRSRAISLVLAGGVVAAIAGPHIASLTKDASISGPFVATYAALIGLNLMAMALVALIDVPNSATKRGDVDGARPLSVIARQPRFVVAVGGAAIGYGVMILAMTATPLAMVGHRHGMSDTAFVIQWHVLGMFVPSFFTGALIARFGTPSVMLAGIGLLGGHVVIALSGVEFLHFLSALTLLGVGWNFSFIGGTALLTETYRPSEKAKVQGLNDFVIFGVVVTASLASGGLLHRFGWFGVNLTALPFLGAAVIVLTALIMLNARRPSVVRGS